MPKMYIAISQIFNAIDVKDDYNLEELSKMVMELIESVSKESESERWKVEIIIKPIINIFNDFEGKLCLALNFGLRIDCYDDYSKYERLFSRQLARIIPPLIETLYGGYLKIVGRCNDHSYVQNYLWDQFKIPILIDGPISHDDYTWVRQNANKKYEGLIGKYAVFKIFPKEMITLPSKNK